MAKRLTVFSEDHEILGSIMIPYRDAIETSYEAHGLSDLDPNAWYPMQRLLDIFNEMSADGEIRVDFVSLGIEMAAQLPPEVAPITFEQWALSAEAVYLSSNRGTDPGYSRGKMLDKTHALLEYKNPLPDDLLYGSLYGYAKRFLPPGTTFTVYFDETIPRREQGGEVTLIHVTWH